MILPHMGYALSYGSVAVVALIAAAVTALWALVLHLVVQRRPRLPGVLFYPFGGILRVKYVLYVAALAAATAAVLLGLMLISSGLPAKGAAA
jgi:hypothetical protein